METALSVFKCFHQSIKKQIYKINLRFAPDPPQMVWSISEFRRRSTPLLRYCRWMVWGLQTSKPPILTSGRQIEHLQVKVIKFDNDLERSPELHDWGVRRARLYHLRGDRSLAKLTNNTRRECSAGASYTYIYIYTSVVPCIKYTVLNSGAIWNSDL